MIKRSFDISVAFLSLLFLSPFFVIISYLIKRDSCGPVFYWSPRIGKNGRTFRMLKFRTMYERPESYRGPRVTCKGDDRITPFGRWLRETKINELPQLWNVLIGDMSLVGPRPEDPEIFKDWPEEARKEILSIRPGITAPSSIIYHDEESLLSNADVVGDYFKSILPDKLRLDRLYVRNRSFFSDIDIILWTFAIFIPKLAKDKIPEGYFFAGPFARLFNRYVSWFLADLLVAIGATATAGILWRSQEPLNWGVLHLAVFAVVLALMFSGFNSIAGFNRILWSRAPAEDGLGLVVSSGLVTLVILLLNFLQTIYHVLPAPPLPFPLIFIIGLMAAIGFVAIRYRLRLLTGIASRWLAWRGTELSVGERVLIIGAGDGCQVASWMLRHLSFRHAFSIVGIVEDEDPTKHGMRVDGCWVLGGIGDLQTLVKKYDVGVILFAVPNTSQIKEYVSELCQVMNIRLVFVDNLIDTIYKQLAQSITAI